MVRSIPADVLERVIQKIPVQRLGQPDEIPRGDVPRFAHVRLHHRSNHRRQRRILHVRLQCSTLKSLISGFRDLGVQTGDTLLVHSSYKSLGEVDGGPQAVVEALLSALGADGTLIMPTFNFDFNQGKPWDVRKTRSKMGTLRK